MPISFQYQISNFKIKNKKRIKYWILMSAYIENKAIEKIDFVFCNDEYLFELNKKFLSHNTYTDIITFDYSQENKITAEIYISIERVKENAVSFQKKIDEELHRVIIHGVLHCIGYGDKNDAAKKKMRRKENEYLKLLFEIQNS